MKTKAAHSSNQVLMNRRFMGVGGRCEGSQCRQVSSAIRWRRSRLFPRLMIQWLWSLGIRAHTGEKRQERAGDLLTSHPGARWDYRLSREPNFTSVQFVLVQAVTDSFAHSLQVSLETLNGKNSNHANFLGSFLAAQTHISKTYSISPASTAAGMQSSALPRNHNTASRIRPTRTRGFSFSQPPHGENLINSVEISWPKSTSSFPVLKMCRERVLSTEKQQSRVDKEGGREGVHLCREWECLFTLYPFFPSKIWHYRN